MIAPDKPSGVDMIELGTGKLYVAKIAQDGSRGEMQFIGNTASTYIRVRCRARRNTYRDNLRDTMIWCGKGYAGTTEAKRKRRARIARYYEMACR